MTLWDTSGAVWEPVHALHPARAAAVARARKQRIDERGASTWKDLLAQQERAAPGNGLARGPDPEDMAPHSSPARPG
jgi:hypothetical protein